VNIKSIIIERFAKFMVGGVPFESMKRVVADYNDADLTGAQKRVAVTKEFLTLGYALAGVLVNLALELAVVWLKNQEAK